MVIMMKNKRILVYFGLFWLFIIITQFIGNIFSLNDTKWYMLVRVLICSPFFAIGCQRLGDVLIKKNILLALLIRLYGVFLTVGLFISAMMQLFG